MQLIHHHKYKWTEPINNLTILSSRLIHSTKRVFRDSRVVLHAGGKLRRLYLVHFQKGYVLQQLSVRQGNCRQCGTCCNLLFTCPMLTTKKESCLVYGTCRPQSCKVFPIDQRDIDEVKFCGCHCGYSFKK